jgi:hypothetical protein
MNADHEKCLVKSKTGKGKILLGFLEFVGMQRSGDGHFLRCCLKFCSSYNSLQCVIE